MRERNVIVMRWLPVLASAGLVILITVVSAFMTAKLRKATSWRKRTFQAVLDAQAYEDSLLNAQSHVQRYVAKGAPELLIEYRNDTNAELREFNKLSELLAEDAEQRKRLQKVHAAIGAVFDHDNDIIGLYARQGSDAALQLERSERGAGMLEATIKELEEFKSAERRLLDQRDAAEQAEYHKAAHLLVAVSIVAAALLVLSNVVASREMSRRRKAEEKQRELIDELQGALAEVKTLSGLIPICGWCKKIRSDEGYWQNVEQYLSTRTEAQFSHGICPACAKKWEEEVDEIRPGE